MISTCQSTTNVDKLLGKILIFDSTECSSISRRTDLSICSTIAPPRCSPTGCACTPASRSFVRDRAGAYAEDGRQGAPDAIQVADRFHLSANAGAALDEVLRSRRRHIEYVVVSEPAEQPGPTPTAPLPPPSQTQQNLAIRRTRRSARWDEVRNRRAAGYSIQRIAREMGMHRRTVRRYLATPAPPRNHPSERPRPSGLSSPTLQPYVEYLQCRWQAGCTNVAQLQREVEAQGYQGSYSLLMQALQPLRGPRPPDQLERYELDALRDILERDEPLALGIHAAATFPSRHRQAECARPR